MKGEIKLGVKAKDVVTGFTGIVTAITRFLTGCDRVQLTPESIKGDMKDSCSFDITSLQYINEGVVKHFTPDIPKPKAKKGGPVVYFSKPGY